jgi:catechol 2,3-dioxygenase-like lactoylglutathione lyase family enzyme
MQNSGILEHANLSVTQIDRLAGLLCDMLGWQVRWRGPHHLGGETAHVGSADCYVSLYSREDVAGGFSKGQPLNHLGLQVADLDAAEAVVKAHGLTPYSHGTYEPGPRSFYFFDWDGIEFEVVSYTPAGG